MRASFLYASCDLMTACIASANINQSRADEIDEGRLIFHDLCAPCHGKDMANPGLAFDLRTFPHDDPTRFRNSVSNGKGQGMPAWKDKLTPEDIDLLWAYVKSGG